MFAQVQDATVAIAELAKYDIWGFFIAMMIFIAVILWIFMRRESRHEMSSSGVTNKVVDRVLTMSDNIAENTAALNGLTSTLNNIQGVVNKHEEQIDDHEVRIVTLEHKGIKE